VEPEILLGRLLASCVNPRAAWPRLSFGGRILVGVAYAISGYVVTLAALLLS
jgi:hypothetical protein